MLEGADYDKAMAKFQKRMEKYEKLYAQRENEEQRIGAQADFARTFRISGFGIYNCDRLYNLANAQTINATVELPEDVYAIQENLLIYHVTGENRAVMTRTKKDMEGFRYVPTEENYLVCILGPDQIALFPPEDFEEAKQKARENDGKATLQFQKVEREIASAADLRIALGI